MRSSIRCCPTPSQATRSRAPGTCGFPVRCQYRPRRSDELALAAKELDGEVRASGTRVLFIGDLYAKSRVQMRDILAKRGLPTDEDHAGIPDTSSLLYLETQGQWVRKDKIALADPKNGVRGHPQQASAELGKIYLDLKVDLAVKQIRSLLAASK